MFKRNMFSRILAVVLTLCLIFSFSPFVGAQSVGQTTDKSTEKLGKTTKEQKFITNQLIIKLTDKGLKSLKSKNPNPQDTGITALNNLNKKLKVTKVEKLFKMGPSDQTLDKWYMVTFKAKKSTASGDPSEVKAPIDGIENLTMGMLANVYERQSYIEKAELNYVAEINTIPNDTYYSTKQLFSDHDDLWGLKKIGAEQAWNTTTGNNVVVAVLDTGVDYNHPDLKDNILRDSTGKVVGYDFANNDSDPMDDHFHGTHVAGTIAAVGNNDTNHSVDSGTRLVGVGWNLKIMPIKALDANGSGSGDALVNGLKFAADNGAKVVNNSWGAASIWTYFEDVIKYVHDKGSVPMFAAGNDSRNVSSSDPSGNPYTVTVGASNYLDKKASFSNYGARMDFLAPGGDAAKTGGFDDYILSTRLQNASKIPGTLGSNYAIARGTSMAAPHASGAAAMILAAHPDYSVEEVRFALRNTADKIFGVNWDEKGGFGRINLAKAILLPSAPPVAYITMKEAEMSKIYSTSNSNVTVSGIISAREGVKSWTVSLGQGDNPTWTVKSTGTGAVNGTIATINTTGLASGIYTIKLEVTDNKGQISQDFSKIIVDSDLLPGWPKINTNLTLLNQPAMGDIDGDGRNELVFTGEGYVYSYRADGSSVPGFPRYLSVAESIGLNGINEAVLSDINNDGKLEIIVSEYFGYDTTSPIYSRVWVLKYDGTTMPGWPQLVPSETQLYMPATAADINADGKKEIIEYSVNTGKVYAYNIDGSIVSGWPVSVPPTHINGTLYYSVPVASDINGDGKQEVFVGNVDGNIYAFNYNGTLLAGWPKKPSIWPIYAPIGIADVNFDGKKEIVSRAAAKEIATFTEGSNVSVYTADGSVIWSKNFIGAADNSMGEFGVEAKPVFADLTSSKGLEMVFPHEGNSEIHALDSSGNSLSGWPIKNIIGERPSFADINNDGVADIYMFLSSNSIYDGVNIFDVSGNILWQKRYWGGGNMAGTFGDFDGDGKMEVATELIKGKEKGMFVWKLSNTFVSKNQIVWGQYMKDAEHTDTYQAPIAPVASNVTVSGTTSVGKTLTGTYIYSDANGDPEGVSTYKWLSSTTSTGTYTAILGATGKTYALTTNDINKYIKLEVTPVSQTGIPNTGTPVQSTAAGPVTNATPNSTPVASAVSVSGTAQVGQTLTGDYTYSDEDGDLQGASTFRWLNSTTSDGTYTAIAGATGKTYTLTANDATKYIKFEVTPISTTGVPSVGNPVQSQVLGPVIIGSAPYVSMVNISGTPSVGLPLAGKYSYFDSEGDPERGSTFRWLSAGPSDIYFTAILGATESTYVPTINDLNKKIVFEVTPVSATGVPNIGKPSLSGSVGPVKGDSTGSAPVASNVTVSGTTSVGKTLTGTYIYSDANGDLEGVSTYKWLSSTTSTGTYTAIVGATGKTYTLTANDANKYIKFEVTPVSATGTPNTGVASQSAAAGPVTGGTTNSAPVASAVSVNGVTTVGQTLTGNYSYSDADGDLQGASTYRWLSSTTSTGTYTTITGATNKTYTLQSTDANKYIKFEVTPVSSTGTPNTGVAAQSSFVGPVTSSLNPAPPVASRVTISGRPVVGKVLTGKYTYSDANGDPEGASILKWYRADTIDGVYTAVADGKTYTLTSADVGKHIRFEVTTVSTVYPYAGTPVSSKIIGPVK